MQYLEIILYNIHAKSTLVDIPDCRLQVKQRPTKMAMGARNIIWGLMRDIRNMIKKDKRTNRLVAILNLQN